MAKQPVRLSGFLVFSFVTVVSLTLLLAGCSPNKPKQTKTVAEPPASLPAPLVDPWKEAAAKIEEDRGEPMGRKAKVATPAELQHYSDRRRFLSIQTAAWQEQEYDVPEDYVALVDLIKKGELVELSPLGEAYILYGVGYSSTTEPFMHYDRKTGAEIPLLASEAEYQAIEQKLSQEAQPLQAKISELQKDLRKLSKRDRRQRRNLQGQISSARQSLAKLTTRRKKLAEYYQNEARRQELTAEYEQLAQLAASLDGDKYDLKDPASRRKFKMRLLSFIRPEAKQVIEGLAASYKAKFDRHLPLTSLIRTTKYQEHLSKTNPNAARIAVPPHTTGLAFDVFYFYMTAEEQNFLMAEIAKLEEAGRVEALRENRDHIHIFAFADGRPPAESLVQQAMGRSAAPKVSRASRSSKTFAKRRAARKSSTVAKSKQRSKKGQIARAR